MTCGVLVPDGKIAMGKLSQAIAHGATLLQVDGNFDDCLTLARKLAEAYPVELVNSVNPARIEGQKTAALRGRRRARRRARHPLPAGRQRRQHHGLLEGLPRVLRRSRRRATSPGPPRSCRAMWGFQAAGAAPLVLGHPVDNPETVATAIRIGNPASWEQAIAARDESGGRIDAVTDEQILEAHRYLSVRGGRLRRARLGRLRRRPAREPRRGPRAPGGAHRLHRHRPRAQGPAVGPAHRRRLRGRARPGSPSTRSPRRGRSASRADRVSRVPRDAPSGSACPRAAPTSAPASTRSASRSASGTTTSSPPSTPRVSRSSRCPGRAQTTCPRTSRHLVCATMRHTWDALGTVAPVGLRLARRATACHTAVVSGPPPPPSSRASLRHKSFVVCRGARSRGHRARRPRCGHAHRERAGGPSGQRVGERARRPDGELDAGRDRRSTSVSVTVTARPVSTPTSRSSSSCRTSSWPPARAGGPAGSSAAQRPPPPTPVGQPCSSTP